MDPSWVDWVVLSFFYPGHWVPWAAGIFGEFHPYRFPSLMGTQHIKPHQLPNFRYRSQTFRWNIHQPTLFITHVAEKKWFPWMLGSFCFINFQFAPPTLLSWSIGGKNINRSCSLSTAKLRLPPYIRISDELSVSSVGVKEMVVQDGGCFRGARC